MGDFTEGSTALIPQEMVRCDVCGEEYAADQLLNLEFQFVCDSCLKSFCSQDAALEDHTKDFILENQRDYYFEWWLQSEAYLPDVYYDSVIGDVVEVLKKHYARIKAANPENAKRSEQAFALDRMEDFADFVKRTC